MPPPTRPPERLINPYTGQALPVGNGPIANLSSLRAKVRNNCVAIPTPNSHTTPSKRTRTKPKRGQWGSRSKTGLPDYRWSPFPRVRPT